MVLPWVLRQPEVTSALIGASRVTRIEDAVAALGNPALAPEEVQSSEEILENR